MGNSNHKQRKKISTEYTGLRQNWQPIQDLKLKHLLSLITLFSHLWFKLLLLPLRILVPGAFHCVIMQCAGTTKHNIALQVRLLKVNVIFSTYFQNRCSPQITQNILVKHKDCFLKSVSCLEPLLLVPLKHHFPDLKDFCPIWQ